jgi:hypothetical protein
VSQLDFQSALTRLLSDSPLRTRFREAPFAVATELVGDTALVSTLCALDSDQLDRQAETLLRKRQAHVAEIIPRTWKQSGGTAAALFREFAEQSPWPSGHRRHFQDAAGFCEFLKSSTLILPVAAEYHWAAFVADNRRLAVRFDLKLPIAQGTRVGLQLFCRNRQGTPMQISAHL